MKKKTYLIILIVVSIIVIGAIFLTYNYYLNKQEEANEINSYNAMVTRNELYSESAKKKEEIAKEKEVEEQKKKEEAKKLEEEKAKEEAKKLEEEKLAQEEVDKKNEEKAEVSQTEEVVKEESGSETSEICSEYYANGILLVNKNHCLPETYAPGGLTSETQSAYNLMVSDAASEGIYFSMLSGYRSYSEQVDTYNYWVATLGQEQANKVSAVPGYSEHQTGMAIDVGVAGDTTCDLQTCFGETKEGIWLANNAHYYGFIIRYPSGKEHITGYSYEPWHIRYVGVEAATEIYNSGITLEEYLGEV